MNLTLTWRLSSEVESQVSSCEELQCEFPVKVPYFLPSFNIFPGFYIDPKNQ